MQSQRARAHLSQRFPRDRGGFPQLGHPGARQARAGRRTTRHAAGRPDRPINGVRSEAMDRGLVVLASPRDLQSKPRQFVRALKPRACMPVRHGGRRLLLASRDSSVGRKKARPAQRRPGEPAGWDDVRARGIAARCLAAAPIATVPGLIDWDAAIGVAGTDATFVVARDEDGKLTGMSDWELYTAGRDGTTRSPLMRSSNNPIVDDSR